MQVHITHGRGGLQMNFLDDLNAGECGARVPAQRYIPGIEDTEFVMDRASESESPEPLEALEIIIVEHTSDIVSARQATRLLVQRLRFSDNQTTIVVTAVSELARNIILYAGRGEITLAARISSTRVGIVVEARDAGPGIADVQAAMESGYSTSGGLGYGLPGVRGMADEFEISSKLGHGTRVVVTMWLH